MIARAAHSMSVYSADEIARAASVPVEHVAALIGDRRRLVDHADAVQLGRLLVEKRRANTLPASRSLFDVIGSARNRPAVKGLPFALSSTLHVACLVVLMFVTTLGLSPTAATDLVAQHVDPIRLVFTATPGPGGGGGGGGLKQRLAPPKAEREGHHATSSPLPQREPRKAIEPAEKPPEPKPVPLAAERLPAVVAPIVTAPADGRDRVGVLEQTTANNDSHGSGVGGGVGSGSGTGIGEGDGTGIGPGSGGGTGGGPYRPGSGIEPPRLLREVKADYTEEARQRGVAGEVVLEIVVRRDGSVGDIKILQGLGAGLNERATQAVRQWRFSPARRLGTPVDVIVEVAVEFKLR